MSEIYTIGKSSVGFLAAITSTGVKPEIVEWLWLTERTVGRAAWLFGWIPPLTSRGGRP